MVQNSLPADKIAEVIADAATAEKPLPRYIVGDDARGL